MTRSPVLLDQLGSPEVPAGLRTLPQADVLRRVWERHFERRGGSDAGAVRLRPEGELPPAAEGIESPYDPEARYRSKSGLHRTGYAAVLSETCDAGRPHLITHVATIHGRGPRGQLHHADPAGADRAVSAAG
jgi:transposase